jgi:hypothetical protein
VWHIFQLLYSHVFFEFSKHGFEYLSW